MVLQLVSLQGRVFNYFSFLFNFAGLPAKARPVIIAVKNIG